MWRMEIVAGRSASLRPFGRKVISPQLSYHISAADIEQATGRAHVRECNGTYHQAGEMLASDRRGFGGE